MRKIFTGNGQITPYRPWSDERRAIAAGRQFSRLGFDSDRVWGIVDAVREVARENGCSFEEAMNIIFSDGQGATNAD